MNDSMFKRLVFLSAIFIIIGACAKVSAPSGGQKDKLPPVVMKCIPENGSVNIKDKEFAIIFNEYVVLDNIIDKFMVSPPTKKKPRVFIKGKSVNVEFDEDLKDSTTYTLYFEDAIKDLNEGNKILNYQYVFSTGPVLDSLSVTGNVYNASNLEVPEKTLVLLYRNLNDSAVVKQLPDYISRVNPLGYFRIANVRKGKYRLYALKDADNSKNFNIKSEEFAFMNTAVVITTGKNYIPIVKDTIAADTIKVKKPVTDKTKKTDKKVIAQDTLKGEYPLFLFAAKKKEHYLTGSSREQSYLLKYTLSLPPDSMKVEFSIPGVSDSAYFIENSRDRDTLKVWLTDSTLFKKQEISTIIKFPFTDTLGVLGYSEDTLPMRFITPRAIRGTKVKKTVFTADANINGGYIKPNQSIITFTSQTPFSKPDISKIHLYELTEKDKNTIPFTLTKDKVNSCKYYLTAKFALKKKYLYVSDSAAFSDIYKLYSDSVGIKFSVKEPETYCTLTLNISNCPGNRIIQLLNKTENLVSEAYIKKDGKQVFSLLEPGFYRLRVIFDQNNDKKWTTGDFDNKKQPEPVSYYPGEIELKTGWDAEQDWDISLKNIKDQKLRVIKKTN